MDIKQVQSFIAVAEQLSFSGAAKMMGIVPSALTAQIQSLEAEIGAPLFVRSSHSVELTPVGRAMLPQARKTVAEFNLITETCERAKNGDTGHLSVAYARALPWYLPGHIIGPFTSTSPGVRVDLSELTSKEQVRQLVANSLDFGIMIGSPEAPELSKKLVSTERIFIACGPTHRFAKREGVSVHELRDEPVSMLSYGFSPEIFACIIDMCREAGFYPQISYEADEVRVLWGIVTSGRGITFGYRSFATSNIPGLVFLPVLDTSAHLDYYVAWSDTARDALKQRFIDAIPEYQRELAG